MIYLILYFYNTIKENTSIDNDSIPNSFFSVVLEPCIICNGEGSYDYVKSIDENVNRSADVCTERISNLNNDAWFVMTTVDECNLLIERCVVCHKDNNKNNSNSGNSNKTSSINNNNNNR